MNASQGAVGHSLFGLRKVHVMNKRSGTFQTGYSAEAKSIPTASSELKDFAPRRMAELPLPKVQWRRGLALSESITSTWRTRRAAGSGRWKLDCESMSCFDAAQFSR